MAVDVTKTRHIAVSRKDDILPMMVIFCLNLRFWFYFGRLEQKVSHLKLRDPGLSLWQTKYESDKMRTGFVKSMEQRNVEVLDDQKKKKRTMGRPQRDLITVMNRTMPGLLCILHKK